MARRWPESDGPGHTTHGGSGQDEGPRDTRRRAWDTQLSRLFDETIDEGPRDTRRRAWDTQLSRLFDETIGGECLARVLQRSLTLALDDIDSTTGLGPGTHNFRDCSMRQLEGNVSHGFFSDRSPWRWTISTPLPDLRGAVGEAGRSRHAVDTGDSRLISALDPCDHRVRRGHAEACPPVRWEGVLCDVGSRGWSSIALAALWSRRHADVWRGTVSPRSTGPHGLSPPRLR